MHKLKCSSVMTISSEKARNNSKPLITFMPAPPIKMYISAEPANNYLIPFLSEGGLGFMPAPPIKKVKIFSILKLYVKLSILELIVERK